MIGLLQGLGRLALASSRINLGCTDINLAGSALPWPVMPMARYLWQLASWKLWLSGASVFDLALDWPSSPSMAGRR